MFLGFLERKVRVVKVKRKKKVKKAAKPKTKKSKIKKAKVRKRVARTKKKPVVKKVRKVAKPKKIMPQVVGKVTHYFPHVKAGVIKVSDGTIAIGDTLRIKGHTTDFKQKITSIQINNVAIKKAEPGQEIGILVKSRVRHNDTVYKVK